MVLYRCLVALRTVEKVGRLVRIVNVDDEGRIMTTEREGVGS